MNITVYCGASGGNDPEYTQKAGELGKWIADNGHVLIYGAGGEGMMGAISNTCIDNGGEVIGIIPNFMVEREWENKRLTNVIHTESMSDRRNKMLMMGDIFIALPGGIGTQDEISEAICMLGLFPTNKKCVFYNTNGYYDELRLFYKKMVDEGFFDKGKYDRLFFIDSIKELDDIIAM